MSITENTSVYRMGRRQGRSKRTEGVCERSKRAQRAQCPRDQEGKKAGEERKKVPNAAVRIAARCLANGCRTPGASGHQSQSIWWARFHNCDSYASHCCSVFLVQTQCFESSLTHVPLCVLRCMLPEGCVPLVQGLYSKYSSLYISEKKHSPVTKAFPSRLSMKSDISAGLYG